MFDDVNNQTPTPAPTPTPTPAPTSNTPPAASGSEEIHTMPMDYYTGGKTANIPKSGQPVMQATAGVPMAAAPGGKKKLMNIIIVVVLVLVVGVSAYLLYASYQTPQNNQNTQQVVKDVVKDEPKKDEQSATEEPATKDENTPPPVDIPKEEPKTEDLTPKFDPNKQKEVSLSLMASLDKDKDGLTDAEETLIGTDANLNDTDKDTYADGAEIKNYYSPFKKGSVRLNEESFVKIFENPAYGYKLLYPSAWLASPLNATDPSEVMFTSKGNEFVSVFIDTKKADQTLEAWYLEKAPNVIATQVKKYQNYKKLPVVESPDGFTAYIANGDKVYILNYNIGLNEEANYPALFAMMINSFEIIPIQPISLAPSVDFANIMKALNVATAVDNSKVVTDFPCGNTTCFYDAFNSCESSIGTFKLADNLTYEIKTNGWNADKTGCTYSSRFTKIADANWAGKTMTCKYNPDTGFDQAVKVLDDCTGDLIKLIQPEKP